MILDSSAIIAMMREEAGHQRLFEVTTEAERVGCGSPTLFETAMVLTMRIGPGGRALLNQFADTTSLLTIPFDAVHGEIAVEAFMRFGKGRHPAALNFGDCMTYAVAKLAGEPLLCIGNDFSKTDLQLVLEPS